MFKKLLFIIILLSLVIGGLQIFGERDFGQMTLAWDKYNNGGNIGSFFSDVVVVFKGEKVKESALPLGKYADRYMYRWKDELGQIHVSERQPNVAEFEKIRIGDLKFDIQKGMTKEEINQVLKTKD